MDTKNIRDIPFPSVSVCRPLSWTWPSITNYLHKIDVNGSMTLQALASGNLMYLATYQGKNRAHCEKLLEDYDSITTEMINEFSQKNRDFLFYFHFAINQLGPCYKVKMDFENLYGNIFLSKNLNPELDISNMTAVYIACPSCWSTKDRKKVQEWFEKDLTSQQIFEGNCTSNTMTETNSVMKWCKKCWEEENECNNCWDMTKSKLIDLCTLMNNQPSNWQKIDLYISKFVDFLFFDNHSRDSDKMKLSVFQKFIASAEKTNQINILALWKFLQNAITDTLDVFSIEEYESKVILDLLAKNNQNEIFESLQAPKIHGDYENEYVLVPYCSFGNKTLRKCDLFKRQTEFYLNDQLCYTFNQDGNYSGYSLHPLSGLNFVINFRVPGNDLSTYVIVHSSNEVPYIDHLPATSIELGEDQVGSVTIGVEASITNISSNFASMKESKRKCFPNIGKDRFYSRNKCMMEKAIELAEKTCECLPWFMQNLTTLQSTVCDPISLKCFDKFAVNYLDSNDNNECPQECVTTEYSITYDEKSKSQIRQDIFGEKWMKYLAEDNPMYYVSSSGPYQHKMIHVNFVRKNANVIIKDARVTFADMLGTIGGTFGVFIGLSFVGVLDFFIWIWNWIKQMRLLKTTSFPRRK